MQADFSDIKFFMKLAPEVIEKLIGKGKTWHFTWDEPISTEQEKYILLIGIRFIACESRRLTRASTSCLGLVLSSWLSCWWGLHLYTLFTKSLYVFPSIIAETCISSLKLTLLSWNVWNDHLLPIIATTLSFFHSCFCSEVHMKFYPEILRALWN